jgi:hypothetical protein
MRFLRLPGWRRGEGAECTGIRWQAAWCLWPLTPTLSPRGRGAGEPGADGGATLLF